MAIWTFDSLFTLSISLTLAATVLLVFRPFKSGNRTCCEMVPENVYRLCHCDRTVTSELARDPTQHPLKIFHRLYRGQNGKSKSVSRAKESAHNAQDSLKRAYECGRWENAKPSTLFLKVSVHKTDTRLGILTHWSTRYITMPCVHLKIIQWLASFPHRLWAATESFP